MAQSELVSQTIRIGNRALAQSLADRGFAAFFAPVVRPAGQSFPRDVAEKYARGQRHLEREDIRWMRSEDPSSVVHWFTPRLPLVAGVATYAWTRDTDWFMASPRTMGVGSIALFRVAVQNGRLGMCGLTLAFKVVAAASEPEHETGVDPEEEEQQTKTKNKKNSDPTRMAGPTQRASSTKRCLFRLRPVPSSVARSGHVLLANGIATLTNSASGLIDPTPRRICVIPVCIVVSMIDVLNGAPVEKPAGKADAELYGATDLLDDRNVLQDVSEEADIDDLEI
jgi:hypothetical protein